MKYVIIADNIGFDDNDYDFKKNQFRYCNNNNELQKDYNWFFKGKNIWFRAFSETPIKINVPLRDAEKIIKEKYVNYPQIGQLVLLTLGEVLKVKAIDRWKQHKGYILQIKIKRHVLIWRRNKKVYKSY